MRICNQNRRKVKNNHPIFDIQFLVEIYNFKNVCFPQENTKTTWNQVIIFALGVRGGGSEEFDHVRINFTWSPYKAL